VDAVLTITKALADESRLRAVRLLSEGELCLCQLVDVMRLSPATLSKHLSILRDAGLVRRRKEGRWHYYRLARGKRGSPAARSALRWALRYSADADHATLADDAKRRCRTLCKPREVVARCYSPDNKGTP
jgi:ArsR family transcriptional regulator, arsenate/arsenite/antimonite-responsive transcriptional repressor